MNNIKSTFILRNNRQKEGKSPIYLRIIVEGRRRELSTKKYIEKNRWNSEAQKVRGSSPTAKALNRYLEQLKRKVLEAETKLLKENREISAAAIKNILRGEKKKPTDLIAFFSEHNKKMEELIGKEYAIATYKKYRTCLKHIKAFVQKEFKQNHYLLSQLNLAFIKDFEHFLKTKKNPCSHNSSLKYISHLKKVVREALERELLTKDPFKSYNETYNVKDPVYLTHQELKRIEKKKLEIGRVDQVRDVYLFCCYTGLSYSDVEKLRFYDIDIDKEGEQWLIVNRTKTNEPSKILLLPIPQNLIAKYKDSPLTSDGNLLPVISNQKTNAYLKEVAALCNIQKHLTFHSARHTFATTVALENGMPMETVQNVLGHRDFRSTKRYCRVTRKKVGREMKRLRNNI